MSTYGTGRKGRAVSVCVRLHTEGSRGGRVANPKQKTAAGGAQVSAPFLIAPVASVPAVKTAKAPPKASKSSKAKPKAKAKAKAKVFRPSFFSSTPQPLSKEFATLVTDLEDWLKMKVWICIHRSPWQPDPDPYTTMDPKFVLGVRECVKSVGRGKPVAILLDSPGGQAKSAYQAAMLLRRHCSEFPVVVPAYAKSGATLFCLGASRILLGEDAELGPLDVQIFDADRDGFRSALDEVQALESLHSEALEAFDSTMYLLAAKTGKSIDKLMPLALDFCLRMMQPLLEKIDTVHFTQMSRLLKEAQEYATRLLQPKYTEKRARMIAAALVKNYPVHGFEIDRAELGRLGFTTEPLTLEQEQLLHDLHEKLPKGHTTLGFLLQGAA
jgi:hypothetical protein